MRSGFVSIIGRPNTGKSTLLNTVLKTHLAIVSNVAGTTRNAIQGVYNDDFMRYNEKASDVRKKDSERLEKILQNSNVSNIIIVWELDFRKNPTLCLQKIIENAKNRLNENGFLFFETGIAHKAPLELIAKKCGFLCEALPDLSGRQRYGILQIAK